MQSPIRFRSLDALLLVAAALFSFATVAGLMLSPKDQSEGVAVIFAPWTNASDAIAKGVSAGGRFVRFGAFEFIAIVKPDSDHYASRVFEHGAWFVADPAALAACLQPFSKNKV